MSSVFSAAIHAIPNRCRNGLWIQKITAEDNASAVIVSSDYFFHHTPVQSSAMVG